MLLVEDNVCLRQDLAEFLREAGHEVWEAGSGETGLAYCKSVPTIDVLCTDINLATSLTGWDVAVSARKYRPNLPVLYTSGDWVDPEAMRAGQLSLREDIQRACNVSFPERRCRLAVPIPARARQ